ncbi:MAG: S-methyl-5-thioribose kinase, partial [Burkholderiales bacterium]|nr:S-methyl-5-thioribose kinase [Burkholderiales bacterium]
MGKTKYSLTENLIIKSNMPSVGIVSSNPKRAERIAYSCLQDVILLTEYQSAWALDIYIGKYKDKFVFVAGVALGASGASFAIQQLASAGAKVIIRYGSNDNPGITKADMAKVILVDSADNLVGLMHANGEPEQDWGKTLYADTELVAQLNKEFKKSGLNVEMAICHHVEDLVAYNYPVLHPNYKQISNQLEKLYLNQATKLHCRDMETAALFYRAKIDGFVAATVLQNIPKIPGKNQVYYNEVGETARQMEPRIAKVILDVIVPYSDEHEISSKVAYVKLDENNVKEHLGQINDEDYSLAKIKEIGDGNLNQVFRVNMPDKSLIVKQSLPYLRCVGEEYLLDKIRIKYEIAYLKIAANLCENHIPRLYYTDDKKMMVIHMQDLNKHQLMRDGLINGIKYPNFAQHIAKFLATMMFKTSRNYLDLKCHVELIKTFNDNTLRSLTENFIFTFPYIEHETNYKNLPHRFSFKFRNNMKFLLDLFATSTETLSHGDLHTGSIFINEEETYIIDGEFAFMGPAGFDLGLLIANLITAYIHHKNLSANPKSKDIQSWLITTIEEIITNFAIEYKKLSIEN